MSSLLLSQSIISSAENSLREKSFQKAHHINPHSNSFLRNSGYLRTLPESQQHQQRRVAQRRKEVPKFCWLILVSTLVLILYLFIFSVIAITCYMLFIWIPNDIHRNKLNDELYQSITNHSNILLMGQVTEEDRKILLTKNLFLFESGMNVNFMNFGTKAILLQNKYPALFWNEDFRRIVNGSNMAGAVWINRSGESFLVFFGRKNESHIREIRFEPNTNNIESIVRKSEYDILPISSNDPDAEIVLKQSPNSSLIQVSINEVTRFMCITGLNQTLQKIHLVQNIENCTDTDQFKLKFIAGFENGTHLILFTNKQKALVVPEKILFRPEKEYRYELMWISHLIPNNLISVIGDYFLFGFTSLILLIVLILLAKYLIFKRHSNRDDYSQINESRPIVFSDRHFPDLQENVESSAQQNWFQKIFHRDHYRNTNRDKPEIKRSAPKNVCKSESDSKNMQKPQRKHYTEL